MGGDGKANFTQQERERAMRLGEQLAFEPAEYVTVASMLAHAKSALGREFQGYRGGDYVMHASTPCHVAEYGCSSFENDPDPGALLGAALVDLWNGAAR